jgi:hypothetical protein
MYVVLWQVEVYCDAGVRGIRVHGVSGFQQTPVHLPFRGVEIGEACEHAAIPREEGECAGGNAWCGRGGERKQKTGGCLAKRLFGTRVERMGVAEVWYRGCVSLLVLLAATGKLCSFSLELEEVVVGVEGNCSNMLGRLRFHTSLGRVSQWFGTTQVRIPTQGGQDWGVSAAFFVPGRLVSSHCLWGVNGELLCTNQCPPPPLGL